MRNYEITVLIHPDREDRVSVLRQSVLDLLTVKKGQLHRFEDIGRRSLAYSVKDMQKAIYLLLNLEINAEGRDQLEHNLRFNESVLRYLIVRREPEDGDSVLLRQTIQEREARRTPSGPAGGGYQKGTGGGRNRATDEAEAPDLNELNVDLENPEGDGGDENE